MEGIKVLVAFVAAHATANIIKVILRNIKAKKNLGLKKDIRIILDSGGMPSAHTACFTGATTMVGALRGFSSLEFAMMLSMLFVIMYDAMNVRRAVGAQGRKLNALLRQKQEAELKIVEGHKPAEVLVGFLIGAVVGSLVWLLMK